MVSREGARSDSRLQTRHRHAPRGTPEIRNAAAGTPAHAPLADTRHAGAASGHPPGGFLRSEACTCHGTQKALLCVYPGETKTYVHTQTCTLAPRADPLTVTHSGNNARSFGRRGATPAAMHPVVEYYSAVKNDAVPITHGDRSRRQRQPAQCKKPDSKVCGLYGSLDTAAWRRLTHGDHLSAVSGGGGGSAVGFGGVWNCSMCSLW